MEGILKDLSIESRLNEIETKTESFLQSIETIKETTTLSQRNHERKKLYKEVEFIRLDIEDELLKLHEAPQEDSAKTPPSDELNHCKDPHVVEYTGRLNTLRNQLKLEIQPSSGSILENAYMLVRLLTFALIMFGGFFIVFFLIPLRWSHLILRKFGISNYWMPMDWIQTAFGIALCVGSGIQTYTNGRDNMRPPKLSDSTIVMFTHGSNLDGLMIQATSPNTLKFIGKKALFMIPIVGWAFRWGFGNIPIDRSNRARSLRSLKALAKAVIEYGRSVAISPEGTRSKCGQLQDFKKGPFYLQTDVNKSITPAIVHGAYELWPPGRIFTLSGKAYCDYLPQFNVDPKKSRNANRLALRRVYLEALSKPVPADLSTTPDFPHVLFHLWFILFLWVLIPSVLTFIMNTILSFGAFFGLTGWGTAKMVGTIMLGLETFMHFTC